MKDFTVNIKDALPTFIIDIEPELNMKNYMENIIGKSIEKH